MKCVIIFPVNDCACVTSRFQTTEQISVIFGSNSKAKLAARTVFGLAHRHGDILREGWRNLLDCLVQLYKAQLLPEVLIRVEDFVDPTGSVCLVRKEAQNMQRLDLSLYLQIFFSKHC